MSGASSVNGTAYFGPSRTAEQSAVSYSCPESNAIRTARGKACHLKHRGFSFVNTGTCSRALIEETNGKPPSPAMSRHRGRVLVVVRAWESRVHGEGGQSMSAAARPLG